MMNKGASAEAEQALAVPVEPAGGLAPTGFDPSREQWVHDPQKLKHSLHNDTKLRADPPNKNRLRPAHRRRVVAVLLDEHGPHCWLCNEPIEEEPTLDHVVPFSRGGRNAIANLRLAHSECNKKRGDGPIPTLLLTDAMRLA